MAISFSCKSQNLKYLYLSNQELKNLLSLSTDRRISFQFFHDGSGTLTLYAWPKKKNTDENQEAEATILHIDANSEPGSIMDNINSKSVLLGNLHIGHNGAEDKYQLLVNASMNSSYQYIIFYPLIEKVSMTGIDHVYYKIYGGASLPTSGQPFSPQFFTLITNTKDPSPPRNAN